jgi:hypothetical protein
MPLQLKGTRNSWFQPPMCLKTSIHPRKVFELAGQDDGYEQLVAIMAQYSPDERATLALMHRGYCMVSRWF